MIFLIFVSFFLFLPLLINLLGSASAGNRVKLPWLHLLRYSCQLDLTKDICNVCFDVYVLDCIYVYVCKYVCMDLWMYVWVDVCMHKNEMIPS